MGDILQQVQDAAKCTQNMQKDITIIKNSVGLSTTPLNTANFTGGRNANASWAQVAAQAKGSAPPPPMPQGMTTTKTQSTVTAYKDRVVTVKLKDHGISQRYRMHPAAWIRQQVEAAIHGNSTTKAIKVVAAHQLKSGDIQIFTSTTAEATQLKESKGWISGLGEHAELIVPTFGVIAHGIPTNSINIKDQKATIQQMLADNYTVIPNAKISYTGWMTKEATLKRASSIVVEFTEPEMANAVIYAGMAWDGQIHQCQLYDRACRIKQCFRCYNYGHIGTQCNASQVCGYCTGQHETKHCQRKGVEGFAPRCAVCKDAHTAWTNACPARRKEMQRVEQAKQSRSTYWHVPLKETSAKPGPQQPRTTNSTRKDQTEPTSIPARIATQRSEDTTNHRVPANNTPSNIRATQQIESTTEVRTAAETFATQTPVAPSIEEDWETPVTQQEPELRPSPQSVSTNELIDPQLMPAQGPISPQEPGDSEPQSTAYPLDGISGLDEAAMQDADAWLQSMATHNCNEWPFGPTETEPSPITSLATDTRTAQGQIYKGCKSPEHQEIYNDWPVQAAELTIAKCMRTCTYCGKYFSLATALRQHIRKRPEYTQKQITVRTETAGNGTSFTPAWTRTKPAEDDIRQPEARMTRSQPLTNSAPVVPHAW
ncbi:hypothetical protein VFPPC_18544 [Pochonia chlamydosporia 170]|uniref:C2H2-type domain-containing protein n=1 Tax=Pochonia chlamydosporia 170 TaxID=1380566 RepID=A0A219ARK9_METCM|nr:hypothetical protein VFPPC_18544 [Pochonia chlamydosporia 170]OWT43401.1 hypothetical protein VFPPC_18544 [Pochonia chlamydosporia 170]